MEKICNAKDGVPISITGKADFWGKKCYQRYRNLLLNDMEIKSLKG